MPCHKLPDMVHIRNQRLVLRLFQRFIQYENQRWKHRHTSRYSKHNALCHYQPQIHTQSKTHKAKGDKTCHCSNRTPHHRREGFPDSLCHRFFSPLTVPLLFLITVPEENGIIHRYTQLQHSAQRFCYIRNLPKNNIAPQIIGDCHPDADKEDKGYQIRIHRQRQNDAG